MTKITSDNKHRGYVVIQILVIIAMVFLMLMDITSAIPYAYITNELTNSVSVIDTTNNNVTATVNVGFPHYPNEVAVIPDGTKIYITNSESNTVSVINTETNITPKPITLQPIRL